MIDKKRQLWLMISCHIHFSTQEAQNRYADAFVDNLKPEEVDFCLDFLGRTGCK